MKQLKVDLKESIHTVQDLQRAARNNALYLKAAAGARDAAAAKAREVTRDSDRIIAKYAANQEVLLGRIRKLERLELARQGKIKKKQKQLPPSAANSKHLRQKQ